MKKKREKELGRRELRWRVERYQGRKIPTNLFREGEAMAKRKIRLFRELHPEKTYDDRYLVMLCSDCVNEKEYSVQTLVGFLKEGAA